MKTGQDSSLTTAAVAGCPRAMHELGLQCDYAYERKYWLRKAAEKGYLPAMFDYALECEAPEERRRWLTEAADATRRAIDVASFPPVSLVRGTGCHQGQVAAGRDRATATRRSPAAR